MARNESRPLTAQELATVGQFSLVIFNAIAGNRACTLTYTKADGSTSSSTGTLHTVQGFESTMSVKVDTLDKGTRTINMRNLLSVEPC